MNKTFTSMGQDDCLQVEVWARQPLHRFTNHICRIHYMAMHCVYILSSFLEDVLEQLLYVL